MPYPAQIKTIENAALSQFDLGYIKVASSHRSYVFPPRYFERGVYSSEYTYGLKSNLRYLRTGGLGGKSRKQRFPVLFEIWTSHAFRFDDYFGTVCRAASAGDGSRAASSYFPDLARMLVPSLIPARQIIAIY
jgi:hypothetical protein